MGRVHKGTIYSVERDHIIRTLITVQGSLRVLLGLK